MFRRLLPALLLLSLVVTPASAQDEEGPAGRALAPAPTVEIAWNRFYDLPELYAHFDRLRAQWPDLLTMEVIGKSVENRELRVYTLNNPATGDAASKPAMWVDANIHGNEIQGGEAVLYLAWYLLENHGKNKRVTELVDRAAFHLLPSLNPDGRVSWIRKAHTQHSSRTGVEPTDNDGDGLKDEDDADDLDGDGHITSMRKHLPGEGTHRVDPDNPRLMTRAPAGKKGDWILLGQEGIDNDGDGRLNEDGAGGYDMNRAWPSSWQPGHVQYGAGAYPLFWPETRAVASYILDRPNVAAVQSFHNMGGMILRGPGVEAFGAYPRGDLRVYDELGRDGERMLPFYRYMVIWKDLYSVFGGLVNWTYEGLGIISFTNELWSNSRLFPDEPDAASREGRDEFNERLLMGSGWVDWKAYDHPLYGAIEIGGWKKDVGRVPPSFLIEEETHRNALFCILHAEAMPEVEVRNVKVSDLGDGLRAVDAEVHNTRVIPTRTARASQKKVGRPDLYMLDCDGFDVLAGGFRTDRFRPERITLAKREPARLVRETGIPGRGFVRVRWIVRGTGKAILTWSGEKARDVSVEVEIR